MSESTVPSLVERRQAHTHYAAACVGGFLGLFPVVSVARLFGSAQTANLIEFVLAALAGDAHSLALHAAGILLYCAGIVLATVIPKRTKINLAYAALTVDAVCAVVMWRFPSDLPATVYLYPTFFALSFHWCAFKGAYGFTSATIFSTNNLRMFVSALAEIVCNGDTSFAQKAKFFGATLLAFHTGVAVAWLCWRAFGNTGFLFALVPIAVCALCAVREKATP